MFLFFLCACAVASAWYCIREERKDNRIIAPTHHEPRRIYAPYSSPLSAECKCGHREWQHERGEFSYCRLSDCGCLKYKSAQQKRMPCGCVPTTDGICGIHKNAEQTTTTGPIPVSGTVETGQGLADTCAGATFDVVHDVESGSCADGTIASEPSRTDDAVQTSEGTQGRS